MHQRNGVPQPLDQLSVAGTHSSGLFAQEMKAFGQVLFVIAELLLSSFSSPRLCSLETVPEQMAPPPLFFTSR